MVIDGIDQSLQAPIFNITSNSWMGFIGMVVREVSVHSCPGSVLLLRTSLLIGNSECFSQT